VPPASASDTAGSDAQDNGLGTQLALPSLPPAAALDAAGTPYVLTGKLLVTKSPHCVD